MSFTRAVLVSMVMVVGGAVVGCGGGGADPDAAGTPDAPQAIDAAAPDAGPLPVLRNPVDMTDDALALAALQRLGADVPDADTRCGGCHALTNAHLRQWKNYSNHALPCLEHADLASMSSAATAIACVAALSQTGTLDTRALGIWASAGRLPWFDRLYQQAYGAGSSEYQQFVAHVAMPPSAGAALTQGEFDIVAEWFVRGQPRLDFYVPAVGPSNCTNSITHEVDVRIADLAVTGWRSTNISNGLSMYGCAGAPTTLDCLADQPRAIDRTYSVGWEVAPGQLRLLAELPGYTSSFWTRSSADGRFVAHGGGDGAGGSTIIDLTDDSHIGVDAYYDPGFFPDNSGFVFQGSGRNTCAQSILLGHPASISMASSPQCSSIGIGLYQHLGRAVGGDYFSIFGQFVSDNGGFGDDPYAFFGAGATAQVLPMIFDGQHYQPRTASTVPIPNEGDAVISPSSRLMMTRNGDTNGKQLAYVLRAVNATPNANGYDILAPTIGNYCMSGGKPAFSYDERWVVFHHVINGSSDADAIDLGFSGATDPGFAPYASGGASNIYLLDLLTGDRQRITMMAPGQFAYFPHFRSDGWIYFIVKAGGNETVVGSDAALRLE